MNDSCVADSWSDRTHAKHGQGISPKEKETSVRYLLLRTTLVLSVFVGRDYRAEQRAQRLPIDNQISQSHFPQAQDVEISSRRRFRLERSIMHVQTRRNPAAEWHDSIKRPLGGPAEVELVRLLEDSTQLTQENSQVSDAEFLIGSAIDNPFSPPVGARLVRP